MKAYYSNVLHFQAALNWRENAQDYYAKAKTLGLEPHPNSGNIIPQTNDILVFGGGSYGHVAVVESVNSSMKKVKVIEQNADPSGEHEYSMTVANGVYSVSPSGGLKALGWLRIPGSTAQEPTPVMGSLATIPMPPTAGTFTVTISAGSNFDTSNVQLVFEGPGCVAGSSNPCVVPTSSMFAGSVTSSSLSAPATLAAGSFQAYVQNGSGGPISQTAAQFTVSPVVGQNPIPAIQSLSPSSATQNVSGAVVTLSGSGFLPLSTLSFNNAPHAVSYTSSTSLSMILSALDVSNAGSFPVAITNPTPGGGTSGAAFFQVTQPAQNTPSLTKLTTTPNPVDAGQFNVNLTGLNFQQPQVLITGQGCLVQSPCVIPNSVLSNVTSSGLTAPVSINVGGSFLMSVQNGTSGPTSNSLNLTVNPPPVLTTLTSSVNPPKVGIFTLTLTGLNFDPVSAQIEFTGTSCSPCTVPNSNLISAGSMQLVAPVQINNSGTFQVIVRNGKGGIASNAGSLTVQ